MIRISEFNQFGNMAEIAKNVTGQMSLKDTLRQYYLAMVTLRLMGQEHRVDERNLASVDFASNNEEFFNKKFRDSFGMEAENTLADMNLAMRGYDAEYLEFFRSFLNEHRTIQQSFVRGMTRMLADEHPETVPKGAVMASFPMV
jgi:hypothetical protein